MINHSAVAIGHLLYMFGGKIVRGSIEADRDKYQKCSSRVMILDTKTLVGLIPVAKVGVTLKREFVSL